MGLSGIAVGVPTTGAGEREAAKLTSISRSLLLLRGLKLANLLLVVFDVAFLSDELLQELFVRLGSLRNDLEVLAQPGLIRTQFRACCSC